MTKIVLQGYIAVPPSDLEAVLEALPLHIQLTLKEEGCIRFSVEQAREDVHVFHVHEEFVDRNAFEAHQRRTRNSNWGAVSVNVERRYQIKAETPTLGWFSKSN